MRVVALVLLLCGAGIQARAEDQPSPEALAAAKELMAVISPDMMKQLAGSISATFWPVVEQKARADKIDDATIGELRAEFERIQVAFASEAMNDAPPIYARHFTVAELKELTAFYPHADRRQGAAGSSTSDGRVDDFSAAAPARRAAPDRRSLQQSSARARLREMTSQSVKAR
jgi:hypothetical protein